jgi:hypothetical protein
MPYKNSSKTASRRSRAAVRAGLLILVLAALTVSAAPAPAQSLDLGVTSRSDGIRASLLFRWNKNNELVTSLRDGMEARIVFTLRVYQRRGGFLPFLRDRLMAETTVARSAFWDFLDRTFVVESDDGTRSVFQTAPDLLQGFFSLTDFLVLRSPPHHGEMRYVTARARLEPVRLMPPLTIVTLAGAAASYTTAWERKDAQ